ncbi:uncharacterized protein acin1a [Cebidichthys violaceus]|uniref:uncharacterized protein acin1a n=1 Tax=Cebidichthys violaceus TaxID=271503 RepID=UPI0035CB2BE3
MERSHTNSALILQIISLQNQIWDLDQAELRRGDLQSNTRILALQEELDRKISELQGKEDAHSVVLELISVNSKIAALQRLINVHIKESRTNAADYERQWRQKVELLKGKILQLNRDDRNTELTKEILILQSELEHFRQLMMNAKKTTDSKLKELRIILGEEKKKEENLHKHLEETEFSQAQLIIKIINIMKEVRELDGDEQHQTTSTSQPTTLQTLLQAKENEFAKAQAEINKLQRKLRLKSEDCSGLEERYQEVLEQKIAELNRTVDSKVALALQNKLNQTKAQCSGFEHKLDDLQNDLDTKMKELQSDSVTSLALQVSTLTLQLEELKKRLQNTESETKINEQKLQKIIDEKNNELSKKTAELKAISAQPQRLLQIIAIQTQIERLVNVATNETNYDKIRALQDHLNYLIDGIQDENNENTKLMFKILAQQDEIARLEKQEKSQTQAALEIIKDLEDELERVRNQIKEETLELDSSDTWIANLSAQIMELHKKIKPLEDEISDLKETSDENVRELRKRLDLTKKQLQDSELLLKDADTKNFNQIMEIAGLRTQLKKAQKQASQAAENNIDELKRLQTQERENKRLTKTNKDLKQEVKELKMCCADDVNTQCDDLQRQLQQSQEDADRLQQQLHKKEATVKQLQQELEEQNRKNNKLQDDYDKLQNKVRDVEDKTISARQMILDPNTAHPRITLSADYTEMSTSDVTQDVPNHPGRFDVNLAILGTIGFSSGRHYWEVSVAGKLCYHLGMTSESSQRKGAIHFNPTNGFWTVVLNRQGQYRAVDRTAVAIPVQTQPLTLGILLDYKKGQISFYDAGARSHMYSFVGQTFTGKIYPFINFCLEDVENQTPIVALSPGSIDWIEMGSGSLTRTAPGEAQDRFRRLGGLTTPCGVDGKSSGLGVKHPVQCCVTMVGDPSAGPLSLEVSMSVALEKRKMADLEDVTLDGRPLQSLRVADLKAALEERGLSKSGQKNALVKRLKGALMLENLQRTSTAHIGLQPNSQIGEEMSQNSFIKQYLAKQQELLRQRLEREAREAYDTNEPEDHTEVNNSTSCPPQAQDATPALVEQHKPPGPSGVDGLFGAANEGESNRNQEADVSGPPASGSMVMRVPDGEHRPEKESASNEAAADSDDDDSEDGEEDGDDEDWESGARRRSHREPARAPTTRERSGASCQPPQQHMPSLLSPQLRQPTPPPSPPPELSFPLPDTPKQSPPSPDVAQARRSSSTSSSGSSSSGSRSSSPEPPRSGHPERKPGPLTLLARKMESEGAFSGAGWHRAGGEGDRQDGSSLATSLTGRGPLEGLVSAITHTANTAGHVSFSTIPGINQGITGAHSAHIQLPVSVLKATATEERDSEIERERALELERQRKLEQERAMAEERERALALEREERERAVERERIERQQALEREEREKALQRERELALQRERQERELALAKEREEREQALAHERALEMERQRALEQERLERERREREELERAKELERAMALEQERKARERALEQERLQRERALEQERLQRERALEAERREKERIEREKALEQERLERERLERQRALEQERLEREKAFEQQRLEMERALEQERLEREKALERERLEREKAMDKQRLEREKALEQERIVRERAIEQERLKRERALEQQRLECERKEKERIEREKALEQERMEKERLMKEAALEKERKERLERERALQQEKLERERALEKEKERALEHERLEKEKAMQKEKEEQERALEQEKERARLAEKERESHLPPSKRGREIGLTPLPTSPSLFAVPGRKSSTEVGEQEDDHVSKSWGEAAESNAPMSPTPLLPQSSFKKFRFLRDTPIQLQSSSPSMVIKRPRNFSDTPQPRASPVSSLPDVGHRHEEGLQSSAEQEDPQKGTKQEVAARPPVSMGAAPKKETTAGTTLVLGPEKEGATISVSEDKEKESTKKVDEGSPTNPLDTAQRRGRDAKKEDKQARQRSSSNDSSSSESDSGSSSSGSSGSSSSSQEKTCSTTRGRREGKPDRDTSPQHGMTLQAKAEGLKETPKASPYKKETSGEKSNTAAGGDTPTKKTFMEAPTREESQKKRKDNEGEEETDNKRQVKETAMAEPEKLPETSEETPKAFSARKISVSSSKSSPGTGGAEGEQDSGAAAGRKRRWGSSTAVTAKKPSISITTDSLKSLIPDIRPCLGQEAVVDLHPEEAVLSGAEDEERERSDQDLQIRRTVTQVVHLESQENGQKETKRSRHEESEEDDPQGDAERTNDEKMDASFPGAMETQSPSHTSHDVESNTVTPGDTLIRRSISQQKTGVSITIDDPVRTARQPSPPRGKVSSIVHISNLVRPFTLGQLKELLSRTGTLVEEGFWIDKIKSHCYVTYCSPEEAVATRASLHGVKWPQSNPKVLSVDFCQKDELDFHKGMADRPAAEEQGPGAGRSRPAGLPSLLPERDQWAEREREMERREKARAEREWDRDKVREFGKPGEEKEGGPRRSRSRERRRKERGKSKEKKTDKKDKTAEDPPAKLLDDLFRKTKAPPCIYWLPLTDEQFVQREAARAERMKEREKRRKEQDEEEEKKREEERKERMKPGGVPTGERSEGEKEKEKDRDRERDRDRGRDRERERENDKRRDGYRRPEGRGAGGGRRSRSRSDPRERRR